MERRSGSGGGAERDGGCCALGAHSDDLAFSLAGAFRDGRLAGCRPVTVFSRSAYTPARPAGDAVRVTALRKAEDERFFAATAAAPPLWLDLEDAPLRGAGAVFHAPMATDDRAAVRRALARLPAGGTLVVPLSLGGHVDHRLVCGAGCERLRAGTHSLIFYEDLPYAAFLGAEAIAARVRRLSRRLGRPLVPELWTSPRLAEAKRWAVASYPSQTDAATLAHLLRHAWRVSPDGPPAERVWRPAGGESAGRGVV